MRFILFILFTGISVAFGQNIPEEANRYYYRGLAAAEMAKTPAEFDAAIKEFEQAANLAPEWPEVYYKLGMVQEKAEKFDAAIKNLNKYLQLSPASADAATVKGIIYKMEYKRDLVNEKESKINALLSGFAKRNDGNLNSSSVITFTKTPEGIFANISQYTTKDFNQTVSVFFDGSVLKFKFLTYRCPNAPALKQYPCESSVTVEGKVIAASPLVINVKLTDIVKSSGFKSESSGEWVFKQ